MSNFAGFTLTSNASSFGRNVETIGDVNGDGIDDVLVSSSSDSEVFVVYGSDDLPATLSSDDIDGTNGFVVNDGGSPLISGLGNHVAGLGDINGDGIDDFAIAGSSRYFGDGVGYDSSIYVIYGTADARPSVLDVASIDGSNGFRVTGLDGRLTDLQNLGDVNGDGIDDLALSQDPPFRFGGPVLTDAPVALALAPDVDYGHFVLYGGTDLAADGADGQVNVLDIDGTNGFAIEGSGSVNLELGPQSGELIALGDVDGDGFDDFLLQEPGGYQFTEVPIPGATTIVYGTPSPVDELLDTAGPNTHSIDLSAILQTYSSAAVYGVGDINGDGFDDIAVSDPGTYGVIDDGAGQSIDVGRGIVHIAYGSATGIQATFDASGVQDPADGFSIFNSAIDSFSAGRFGENVAGVGDVNNDGIDDLLISNEFADLDGVSGAGTVTLLFGNSAGFDRFTDINSLDTAAFSGFGYQLEGFVQFGDLGESMSSAGDLNNDGIGDFIIGNSVSSDGQAYVLFGGETFLELADNADGVDDNVISLSNLDTAVTGIVPTNVSIDNTLLATGLEADSGTTQIIFTVRRDGDLTRDVSVDFDVSAFGFASADADDFAGGAFPSGTVTFASGSATAELVVEIAGDDDIEPSETFQVTLSNLLGGVTALAYFCSATATGGIDSDYVPTAISVGVLSSLEGDVSADNRELTFTFTREGDLTEEAEVTFDILPSPAPGDFFAADADDLELGLPLYGQTITFAANDPEVVYTLAIAEDTVIEPRETVELRITSVSAPTITYEVTNTSSFVRIVNDDGRPVVIPPGVEADVFGDPHIVTLDGLAYDFQAAGEYILLESTGTAPDDFSVQTRFEPVEGSDLLSITTRAAVTTTAGEIEVDATASPALIVNGVATTLALGDALDIDGDGTDDVINDGGSYLIRLGPNAEEYVQIGIADGFLNVCVFLQEAADGGSAGSVQGLMGNANGALGDDFALRDGSPIPPTEIVTDGAGTPSLSFDFLYGRGAFDGAGFAGSWAVQPDERAFSDLAPEVPVDFPAAAVDLDDIPALVRAEAEAAARAAGLDPATDGQAIFDAAVLDFALTGNEAFLEAATQIAADTDVETDPFDAPVLPATFSILQATSAVLEGDSGTQTVNFLVFRTGDDSTTASFTYAVGGGVDATDLAGAASGTVSFAAGETVKFISVDVQGDNQTEADEALTVTITPTDGANVATSSATTTILTDDSPPVVINAIPDQTGTEDTAFDLDLGTVFGDADGDTLTLTAVSDGGVPGTVTISGGTLTFTPDGNASGVVEITVTADDGNGGSVETSFALTIEEVNDGPTVANAILDQISNEDALFSLDVSDVFEDVDGDELTLSVETDGAVAGNASVVDGELIFDPDADVNGTTQVTLTADDGRGGTVSAIFDLLIAPQNDAPIVATPVADQTGTEDTPFTLDVSDVFDDIDGDALTITAEASSGTATVAGGILTFTPDENVTGLVEIILTADDGIEAISTSFNLDLTPVNDAPVATDDDGFAVEEGQSITISAADLLANDVDVDGDMLVIDSVTSGSGGTAELNVDGDVVFTSDGTVGAADFTYTISDGTLTDTATVTLTVTEAEPENPYEDYRQGTEGRDNLRGNLFSENQIFGAGGDDRISGGIANDSLAGGDGDDRLFGRFGNNLLEGNDGDDRLQGGFGKDTLLGGSGDDKLLGGFGSDILDGGSGNDTAWGGLGSDTFVYNAGDEHFTVRDFDTGGWGWWFFNTPSDKLDINVDGIDSFEDVMATASQVGRNTVFDFGDGDVLSLKNVRLSQLDAEDFLF